MFRGLYTAFETFLWLYTTCAIFYKVLHDLRFVYMVVYDFETCSSNVSYGQIIQAAAVLVNDNFQELDRYEGRCKLNPGIIPECMALLVNNTTPKILKETNLSEWEMVKQIFNFLQILF